MISIPMVIITVCTLLLLCITCGVLERDETENTFDVFDQ